MLSMDDFINQVNRAWETTRHRGAIHLHPMAHELHSSVYQWKRRTTRAACYFIALRVKANGWLPGR